MLSINTNLSSLITQSSLNKSTDLLNLAIERMTTGFKINHAKDNAANYSISTNMTTKIGAYQVAEDNAAMGLDMVTTASENINEMQNHAERLRALAIQARNGTYGKQALNALQEEANVIYNEINRIYSTAKYNGVSLFNQSEYDIPDNMPKADDVTGFIENPYDYTEEQIAQMISISKVNSFESGKTYSISSAKELKHFADIVNAGNTGEGSIFVLAADIDLSEYSEGEGWTPIGDYGTDTNLQFKGTFNGNGHVISNLRINRSSKNYQGLFGRCGARFVIKNVGLENVNIEANYAVGGLIGVGNTGSTRIFNSFVKGNIKGNNTVGGLVGYSDIGKIAHCYTEINVSGDTRIGGLLGSSYYGIEGCFSKGNIEGDKNVGGLIGRKYFAADSNSIISECFSSCNINGNYQVGGLIGIYFNYNSDKISKIENCISFSKVNGTGSEIGSFIGALQNIYNGNTIDLEVTNCKSLNTYLPKIGATTDNNGSLTTYDLSNINAEIEEISLKNINTFLQIGTKGESSSQLSFNSNFEYSLGKIVRNGIDSDEALSIIDDFINLLSEKEIQLGAVSNRLDSVLDEIATQYDNLVSSRSTLRDADMAELSSTYIQQQILQQASATLMATANQTPSIALGLI